MDITTPAEVERKATNPFVDLQAEVPIPSAVEQTDQKVGLDKRIRDLEKAQIPGNAGWAGGLDGFVKEPFTDDWYLDNGKNRVIRPEVRVDESEIPALIMDPEKVADMFGGDLDEWSEENAIRLEELWEAAGLSKEEFPDLTDPVDRSVLYMMAKKQLEGAVEQGLFEKKDFRVEVNVLDALKGKEDTINAEADISKIKNGRVRESLKVLDERSQKSFVAEVWSKAVGVEIVVSRGKRLINVRDEKGAFFCMDVRDFSRMLSIPDVNEGNSIVKLPRIRSNDVKTHYRMLKVLEHIKIGGNKLGGDGGVDSFDVTRRFVRG